MSLLADWRAWWEGVLRAKGGLPVDEQRSMVAEKVSWTTLVYAIRAIDATREQWQNNVSPLLVFEYLTLAIPTLSKFASEASRRPASS
jgi:hypothetical protein